MTAASPIAKFEQALVDWHQRVRAGSLSAEARASLASELQAIERLLPNDVRGRSGVKVWDAFRHYVEAVGAWLDGLEAAGNDQPSWLNILDEGVDDAWEECERAMAAPLKAKA